MTAQRGGRTQQLIEDLLRHFRGLASQWASIALSHHALCHLNNLPRLHPK